MAEKPIKGALSIVQLRAYLDQEIRAILDDGDDPHRYTVEIREHYLLQPPEHATRDRRDKVVFLKGVF